MEDKKGTEMRGGRLLVEADECVEVVEREGTDGGREIRAGVGEE